jgi:Leucine-rich repeat (LRR) protein
MFAFVVGVIMALIGVQYYASTNVTDVALESNVPQVQTPVATTTSTTPVTTIPAAGKQIQVYEGIAVSEMSKVLDLSDRGLTGSLKAEVRLLASLETLDLSGNQFTGLPAEVGQLSELRTLNLSNNDLTGLPHELGNLQKLELLDVRGNAVSSGDMEIIIGKLPATTEILR